MRQRVLVSLLVVCIGTLGLGTISPSTVAAQRQLPGLTTRLASQAQPPLYHTANGDIGPVGPHGWPTRSATDGGYVPPQYLGLTSSPPGWPAESPPWCVSNYTFTSPSGKPNLTGDPPCNVPGWEVNPYNPIAKSQSLGYQFEPLVFAIPMERAVPDWYYRFNGGLVAQWPQEAPAWCIVYDDYDYAGGAFDYGQCGAYTDRYWRPNPLLFPPGNW